MFTATAHFGGLANLGIDGFGCRASRLGVEAVGNASINL